MTFLLILHDLSAVALLGALTHQCVALLRRSARQPDSFLTRYASVSSRAFTRAVVVLYVGVVVLGAILYPTYRTDVRVEFEEMSMFWAVGCFELKEHFAGLGLAMLPAYLQGWRTLDGASTVFDGTVERGATGGLQALTLLLAGIVWWDFLVGHVLNNIRGLG